MREIPRQLCLDTIVFRSRSISAGVDGATIGVQSVAGIKVKIVVLLVGIQLPPPCADVIQCEFQLRRQSALKAEVPLIHSRVDQVFIHAQHAREWADWSGRNGRNQCKRISQTCRRLRNQCCRDSIRRGLRGIDWNVAEVRIVKNARSAVKNGLAAAQPSHSGGSIGKAEARTKVQGAGMDLVDIRDWSKRILDRS